MPESIESAVQSMAGLFERRSREESKQLLAALERAGAAVYRLLASDEEDPSIRDGLLLAAVKEEENAEFLEQAVSRN